MIGQKIMVVAAHPDDETLGCCGTLLKLKNEGHEIYWLIVTNISEGSVYSKERVQKRQQEIEKVSQLYGFNGIFKLDFPTASLDQVPVAELINKIAAVLNKVQPDTLYIPNRSDIHSDHQVLFSAIMSCTKTFRFPFVRNVLMYETISETEFCVALPENAFIPNIFSDITLWIDKKIEIMNVYGSEMGKHPFPRSERNIKALATFRGATIGAEYAESFMLLKGII